jgi:hypothetical protein
MNPVIDLVFFEGCPHVEAARDALRQALGLTGRALDWREWRSDDARLPPYAAGFGSPSIFVAEREVTGARPGDSASACRVYQGGDGGHRPAPEPARIVAALGRAVP